MWAPSRCCFALPFAPWRDVQLPRLVQIYRDQEVDGAL
jgi:hypothetical protein